MHVAKHLGIDLAEYDARIRTFIPKYEEMLQIAAASIPARAKTIVDLGVGTGALAVRCLEYAKRASVVGIDCDGEIMKAAARRLGARSSFLEGDFVRLPLPKCDATVASLALHHVPTPALKARLYRKIRRALRPGGLCVTVDCHPAEEPLLARAQLAAWTLHLQATYSLAQAREYLRIWSHEDAYMPLNVEIELMKRSGFEVEVLWRHGAFAVLRGKSPPAFLKDRRG